MDNRKRASSTQAVEVIIAIWCVVILVSLFDMPTWLAGCAMTVGVALSELRYGIKIDKENATNRKESE